ncbi:anti-sigma regulatory factor [Methylotuvimicrobium buryatense]|uniref:Anti-sigma regulatory factor n=1 Tax=Methylotuvimicrobium buryatense TaxID=95641 RepID=A0A4V1IJU6_METBY|nr:anti-sigma regulatory factor [Methylotuvimicrobium buryatense]QCW82635.1 anti-sigma regulatory factor [Methylotuvimicrobium buryatense]
MAKPHFEKSISIEASSDIVRARSEVRTIAASMGFGSADQTRLATAVSELARNIIQNAGSGVCEVTDISSTESVILHIVFQDNGPGIPDIALAMQDGYSTNGGLGAGLPGTRRLIDGFSIESRPGLTRVSITMQRESGLC